MKPYKRYIGNCVSLECAVGFLLVLFLPVVLAYFVMIFEDWTESLIIFLLPLAIAQIILVIVWLSAQKLFYCTCEFYQDHLEIKPLIGKKEIVK